MEAAEAEAAATEGERRKRRRWSDAEPGASTTTPPAPAAPVTIDLATQKAAAEALRRMNALLGGGGAGSPGAVVGALGFSADVDINDSSKKGLLTKKSTQEEITSATNASVLVRGRYKPPGDSSTTERALHLHIEARTQEELDRAVEMVYSIMGGPPPPPGGALPPQLPADGPTAALEGATPLPSLNTLAPLLVPASSGPQKPPLIRHTIDVGLDSNAGYQIRGKLLGPKGSYLKHIQDQTGVRVQLAGKGSGNLLPDGTEGGQPLHLVLNAQSQEQLEVGKQLAESLVAAVREDYERRVAAAAAAPVRPLPPPPMPGGPMGYPGYGRPPAPYGYGGYAPGYGYPSPYGYPQGYGGYPGGYGYPMAPPQMHMAGYGQPVDYSAGQAVDYNSGQPGDYNAPAAAPGMAEQQLQPPAQGAGAPEASETGAPLAPPPGEPGLASSSGVHMAPPPPADPSYPSMAPPPPAGLSYPPMPPSFPTMAPPPPVD
ncbi:hypothetical protein AB1Y20_023125 [Prymnesium parvum]|uniref:K Homology domain-containing protein n=1 Tax=Prymnesium parvum TaxID=97485 RepID=A0AB34JEJ3_PRYPA